MPNKKTFSSPFPTMLITSLLSLPSVACLALFLLLGIPEIIMTFLAALLIAMVVNHILRQRNIILRIVATLFVVFLITTLCFTIYTQNNTSSDSLLKIIEMVLTITILHFAPIGFYILAKEIKQRKELDSESNSIE